MAAVALSRALQSLSICASSSLVTPVRSSECTPTLTLSLSHNARATDFFGARVAVDRKPTTRSSRAGAFQLSATASAPAVVEEEAVDDLAALRIPFATHRILATGRRKTAVARVALVDGTGRIFVNGIPSAEYFQGSPLALSAVKLPLASLGYEHRYDVIILAHGGGLSAQAQAVMMGIARALCKANQANRTPLKKQGLLTRDARAVERKKYGLKKARKAPQFSKR